MKNPSVKPEDIERVLDRGRRLTMTELAARLGLTHTHYLYKILPEMRAAGRVQSCREKRDDLEGARFAVVYFTGEPPEPVGKPYPAVLLEGTMTGYDNTLRRHAELCLAARG